MYIKRRIVCVDVCVCMPICERDSGELRDHKFGEVCGKTQKDSPMYFFSPRVRRLSKKKRKKRKPPSRIPTGKMLAVMDSYIIQSSTALCMRKGNQSKNKTMFYPGQSAQKSKAAAKIPWPGYIYPFNAPCLINRKCTEDRDRW